MKTSSAIVKLETRPHRTVAQENWGLTAEQMAGMEVHHRVPVSEGGTNDPSNLFVCSPSMHRWGWHSGEAFIGWGAKASEGRDPVEHSETSRRAALRTVELGVGLFGRDPEKRKRDASKAAAVGGKLPWWHNPQTGKTTRSKETPGEGWVRGRNPKLMEKLKKHLTHGNTSGATAAQHATRWRCLVTGHISTPCGLSRWQSARGIDKKLRERVTLKGREAPKAPETKRPARGGKARVKTGKETKKTGASLLTPAKRFNRPPQRGATRSAGVSARL